MSTVKINETIQSSAALTEASTGNKSGKRWRVKVIEAGQGSSAFYPERVLEDYASVFKPGTQMFFDHPSFSEEFERPERSVRDLVGKTVSEAVYEDAALWAEVEFFSWAAPIIEEMADDIGLSIRALGTAEEGENGPVLTAFVEVLSVDVVTRAGAGGALVEMLESARPKHAEDQNSSVESIKENEMNEAQEALLRKVAESVEALASSLTPIVESLSAPKEQEHAPAEDAPEVDALAVAGALADSGLTEAGRKAVLHAVKGGLALDEAITAQTEYETAIAEAAKVAAGVHVVNESKDEPARVRFNKVGN